VSGAGGARAYVSGAGRGIGRIVALSSTGTHVVRNRRYAPLALAKAPAPTRPRCGSGSRRSRRWDGWASPPTPRGSSRSCARPRPAGSTGQLLFSDGGYSLV
jgi:hypothetical protein